MEMYNIVWGNYVLNKKPLTLEKAEQELQGLKFYEPEIKKAKNMKLQELRKLVREEVENMLGSKYNLSLRYPGGIYRTDKDSQELGELLYKVANFSSNKRSTVSLDNFKKLVMKAIALDSGNEPSPMFMDWMRKNDIPGITFEVSAGGGINNEFVISLRTSKDIESARNVAMGLDKLGSSGLD